MAQVVHGEDGPTDGTQGEKPAITRIGQKPDIGQRSPSKGLGGRGALKWSATYQSAAGEDLPLN